MVLTLISSLFGILLGVTSGLLPGIGNGSIILLFLPIFISMNPENVLIAFLSLLISSQYVASVTAIYTGIPGAESAIVTSKEFPNIRKFNLTSLSILQNARSALIGNILGLLLFLISFFFFHKFFYLFKNDIKIGILISTFLIIIFTSNNKIISLLMILFGFSLSIIGYSHYTYETINLGLSFLDNGIPWEPLVIAPLIGSAINELRKSKSISLIHSHIESNYRLESNKFYISTFRGSFLGFIIGFVPGLSYILSSIVSYLIEKRILKNKSDEEKTLRSLASSESGHSSGVLAMLVPFVVFGIPITTSEAIIFNIITIQASIKEVLNIVINNLDYLVISIILTNIVSYFISLKCRAFVKLFVSIPNKILISLLFTFGFISVFFALDYNLVVGISAYLLVTILFSLVSINPLPFIISILLHPIISSTYFIYQQL